MGSVPERFRATSRRTSVVGRWDVGWDTLLLGGHSGSIVGDAQEPLFPVARRDSSADGNGFVTFRSRGRTKQPS
jgi:hypothetical protein